MVITLNPDKIYDNQVSLDEFYFLLQHYLSDDNIRIKLSENSIKKLSDKGFIKLFENKIIIRPLFINTFKEFIPEINSDNWIEDWRNLFPVIKISSRPAKGSKQNVIKKMMNFVKNNPNYTKEDIINVTKMYLFEKKKQNYKYMQCADYFIEKNGVSTLESLLEYHTNNSTDLERTAETGFFQKNI